MMAAEYGAMDSLTLLMERFGATLTEHLAMADNEGNSAVHLACIFKRPSTLALLLDASPSMDVRNNRGRTPLIAAVVNGAAECAMLLLSRGGNALDLDAKQPAGGWTALHLAAHYGYQAIVSLLVHAGADPTIRNIWNATPVAVAQDKGQTGYVPPLEAAIAEPQRSRALFKARALIDARIDIPKARPQARQDGLSLEAQHAAALAAAPVYFKQRVAQGRLLPHVAIKICDEQLRACLKYVLGLEGGGGVVIEGQEPAVGMLPEVFAGLLHMMTPRWDSAHSGRPRIPERRSLGDYYSHVDRYSDEGDGADETWW